MNRVDAPDRLGLVVNSVMVPRVLFYSGVKLDRTDISSLHSVSLAILLEELFASKEWFTLFFALVLDDIPILG